MRAATAVVRAGVCGFVTRVRAAGDDDFMVRLSIESDCEKIQAFAAELAKAGPVSALDEITRGHDGAILSAAAKYLRGCCAACVTPDAAFKAMQVAGGMALPADVCIQLNGES